MAYCFIVMAYYEITRLWKYWTCIAREDRWYGSLWSETCSEDEDYIEEVDAEI